MPLALSQPLVFEPLYMERVWGGHALHEIYGKRLPVGTLVGESWEIVDRPEAQSVVANGPWRGRTLHDLWEHNRRETFGNVAKAPRFPLLVKLLDAREKLSLQVHPPADAAEELGGEPKTEFWYIVHAEPAAELFVGLSAKSDRAQFEEALREGKVTEHVHRITVKTGDAMFLPSGRLHAIGAGNVIVEIQQNSDTTFRVFDWDRPGTDGKPRKLHIKESLRCIDFADCEPELIHTQGETLVRHDDFVVEKWKLDAARPAGPPGKFAIVFCLSGKIQCTGITAEPGDFFLVPSSLPERTLQPARDSTELLRVTLP